VVRRAEIREVEALGSGGTSTTKGPLSTMASPSTSERIGDPGAPADDGSEIRRGKPSTTRSLIEWILVVAGAVAVALLVRVFAVQAFYIPSESMQPTLEVNDRVLVNRLTYHLHDINRGDVVVFEKPASLVTPAGPNEIKDLIKRVVALPGESVVFEGGDVYVDGRQLDEPYLPAGTETLSGPGGATWDHRCTTADPCVVPTGTVWVMGDNRSNSEDSRWIGPVDQDLVVGRAFVTVWPFDRLGGL
jgi:signal peptidase I